MKKTLGIERDAPDEFAVTPAQQPLDMPPDFFVLPTPQPGAPRPQEMKAKDSSGLGTNTLTGATSPGQAALLDLAGREEGQNTIRQEIDTESHIEDAKGKPVLESLGIQTPSQGEALNPHEEAQRLEQGGFPQQPTGKNVE